MVRPNLPLLPGLRRCALKNVVVAQCQHDDHRNDAERGEQQPTGIAAGLVLDSSHRERTGKAREIADRVDAGCGTRTRKKSSR